MTWDEFKKRFFQPGIPILDYDMVPILVTGEGIFSPGEGANCQKHETEESAVEFWRKGGYRTCVLREVSADGS